MSQTQAYTVDWSVTVEGVGDTTEDTVAVTITKTDDGPDNATVTLDTSQTPYAITEEAGLQVTLTDGDNQVNFNGEIDAVKDDDTDPILTLDAREPAGVLDDVTAVGQIKEDNLFDVIDTLLDGSAGQVRGIDFDPDPLINQYGTFANSVIFGTVTLSQSPLLPEPTAGFTQQEISNNGVRPGIEITDYENTTQSTFDATLNGFDPNGQAVELPISLPPGDDAQEAYGTTQFELPVEGGDGLVGSVTDVDVSIPPLPYGTVALQGTVKNYVKTDWTFRAENSTKVNDALNAIVGYLNTIDRQRDWGFRVNQQTEDLFLDPTNQLNPTRYVFTEGDNVIRPVAERSLDGVYNMVKLRGSGGLNAWFWAYGGDFYQAFSNPFENNLFPDSGEVWGNTGGLNDIDQIDMRATGAAVPAVTSPIGAEQIGQLVLKELHRTPVSGAAEVTGIHPAEPNDEAEIYYPSRGIPQQVSRNIYPIKEVEYSVESDGAMTNIDWGISDPSTGDMIKATASKVLGGGGAGGGFTQFLRNDISETTNQTINNIDNNITIEPPGGGGGGAFPVEGEIVGTSVNGFVVEAEDGNTYEDVQVF